MIIYVKIERESGDSSCFLSFNEYICILFKVIGVQTLKYKSII